MIGTDVGYAEQLLKEGRLVAIPTETVYGLAGNALNTGVVASIFEVKNRPSFDPLIVHFSSLQAARPYIAALPEPARQLAHLYTPGPLTLLLKKSNRIPDMVTAGSPWVAIRIPAHPLTHQLLANLPFPLAAPSANPFGYISPTTARHVEAQLGQKLPYILDGGPCEVGLESTIVGFPEGQVVVYRKGGIAVEDIEAAVGPIEVRPHSVSNPKAPGMLKSHYAPSVPLKIGGLPEALSAFPTHQIGLIRFKTPHPGIPANQQIVLSPSGEIREAAQRRFAGMRQLDRQELAVIVAELLPETGLGRAINDRLRRAAAQDASSA